MPSVVSGRVRPSAAVYPTIMVSLPPVVPSVPPTMTVPPIALARINVVWIPVQVPVVPLPSVGPSVTVPTVAVGLATQETHSYSVTSAVSPGLILRSTKINELITLSLTQLNPNATLCPVIPASLRPAVPTVSVRV